MSGDDTIRVVHGQAHDLANLPKWAQEHIRIQEQKAADLLRTLVEKLNLDHESNVFVKAPLYASYPNRYLPDESSFTFLLENGSEIDIRHRGTHVQIMAGRQRHSLLIVPQSGNVAYIYNQGVAK